MKQCKFTLYVILSVWCHAEILLPWQCDVTTSPLHYPRSFIFLPLPWCLTKNHKIMMLRLMDGQSSSLVSCKSIIYLSSHSHELHRWVQKDITWLECFSAKESCSYSKLMLSENGENLQTHWEKREMILFEIGTISSNYTNMWRQQFKII